jgi:hypothetical protein
LEVTFPHPKNKRIIASGFNTPIACRCAFKFPGGGNLPKMELISSSSLPASFCKEAEDLFKKDK